MRFRVLGPIEVVGDGPARLGRGKRRSLLAHLISFLLSPTFTTSAWSAGLEID
jgi:hypothetical protein